MIIKAFVSQKGEIYLFAIKKGVSHTLVITVKETLKDGHIHNYQFVSKDAIFNLEPSDIIKYIEKTANNLNAHEIGAYFPDYIFLPFLQGDGYRARVHEKYELHNMERTPEGEGFANAKFWAENNKQLRGI